MKTHTKWVTSIAAVATMLSIGACSSDTSADDTVSDLAEALSNLTLQNVALTNPEAQRGFDQAVASLREFKVSVSPGEVVYDVSDAVVPLSWSWQIHGNTWEYDTQVDLTYDDNQWLVTWQPSSLIPELEPGQLIGIDSTSHPRADIVGPEDEPIVTLRPVRHYGLDKTYLEDEDVASAAGVIAEAAGVDAKSFVDKVEAAGPKAFVSAISLRPDDVDEWIDDDFDSLPGARVVSDEAFLAPTRTFARELLGRTGEATAQIIEESDGAIAQGDIVGLSGLQQLYDSQLRGSDAVEIFAVNSSDCKDPLDCDESQRHLIESLQSQPPKPLEISLDSQLQVEAEEILAEELGDAADTTGSALVAIRPSTGAIVVVANGEGNQGLNNATVGQYPPGSTFKVVTALALLRSGYDVDDAVSCPESISIEGREFTNYDGYPSNMVGEISFKDAFAYSCNTAWIGLMDEIDGDDIVQAAKSLGLGTGVDSDALGFPAFMGDVTSPEQGTEFAATLIGQGKTTVSPLAMATVAASVYDGTTVTPQLLDGVEAEVSIPDELTEKEAEKLRELMTRVVTHGTAEALKDGGLGDVIAKTGTAEHGDADEAPHAWMIGAAQDLAVAVFVEAGVGGAETAGPILKRFLEIDG